MFDLGTSILNRYNILARLGEGGMGTVFRALDVQRGAEVALKVLNDDQLTVERRRDRFIGEYQILKKFNHPGIVRVFDLHDDPVNAPFFAMELLQGRPLSEIVAVKKSSYDEVLSLLALIATALQHVHEHNCVYLDLKPANIMVVESEAVSKIKLVDFGISKDLSQVISAGESANMVGTSLYMSPEQIRSEAVSLRSDIYSFGVVAFELLTGRVPFEGDSTFQVTASHLVWDVPAIHAYNKATSKKIDRMVSICMEKDPANRYASMGEIIERLNEERSAAGKSSWWGRLLGR